MNNTQFVQITRQSKINEDDFYEMLGKMYKQIWGNLAPPQILTQDLSERIVNNVITAPDTPIPDCQSCGACCQAFTQVAVYPDEKIFPEYYWEITVKGEKGEITVDKFLRRNGETFVCEFLGGKLGEHVSCNIYEQRPIVCRNFEAGSDKCHALRRAFGFEPDLGLMEMYYAVQKLKAVPEKINSADEIKVANFIEQPETGYLEIKVTLFDGSTQIIHTFNPKDEIWHQFEFKGMSLEHAKDLIKSRIAKPIKK